MKYLYILLPFIVLWLSSGLVEAFDLVILPEYGYVDNQYVLIREQGWYGPPYLISSAFAFMGAIFLAILKGSE